MGQDDVGRELASQSSLGKPLTRRELLSRGAALGITLPFAGGLLAACGSNAKPSGSGGGGNSSKGIVVGLDTDIDTLDPISFRSDAAYEAVLQTYEMPVDNQVQSVNGILQGVPGTLAPELATEYSISPDGTVYRFTVRPGVTFSNGHPVNADVFNYSFQRALEGPGYASELLSLLTVTQPSQLVVTGPMTFEIHLAQPNPMGPKLIPLSVLEIMDPVVSKSLATKSDPWATGYYRSHMLGTGPYVQGTTWQSGNQYLLQKNPNYWNKAKVKNGGVLLKYVPSSDDRALLLQQGAIDLAFGLPASKLNSLRGASNVALHQTTSRNTNYLGLNNKIAPLNDPRVRQAIAYAIPYSDLINRALYGFASPLKGILTSSMPTADQSLWPYSTNPAKAKALLAAAGHPGGFNTTLAVSTSRANDLDTATYIQSALKQVGINVALNQVSDADFRTKEDAGELPMFLDYWYSWVDDPFYQMYWLLLSTNKSTNVANYQNPQMDQILKSGLYEPNTATRASLSQKAQQIFANDVPYVPLYSLNFALATAPNVSGVNLFPDQYVRFWMISKP